jgi:hypothetical protein
MSGGSFNYLYSHRDWTLLNDCHVLEEMVDYLKEKAPGSMAHKLAKKQLKRLRKMKEIIPEINIAQAQLEPVFKAVEWHVSCDTGEQTMMEAIAKFESKVKL